ncbi:CS domain-containing protein [Mycena chlorophos]|uniref:CS domain-containing protein n=1 Tax=Mycena chlorophos TaxID=658473 RepID=A0A8H6SZZ5_MYCCL|nr:CS domain-containing protein [Mycena chlorophos]
MKLPLTKLIADHWRDPGPVLRADLSGKTVMLIGANTGLGFEACKYFASMKPARLIMACRSESKGKAAITELAAETGYNDAELWIVDLLRFESVTAFADKWEADGGRLDVLVLNAGLSRMVYEPAQDGWEASVFVNNVATPHLALRLLPSMIRTAEQHSVRPRLVVVASDVHYWVALDKRAVASKAGILHTLADEKFCKSRFVAFHVQADLLSMHSGGMKKRYFVTKLLNVFFVRALAEHLKSAPVTVVAMNPGYCYSNLRDKLPLIPRLFDRLNEVLLALPTAVGAQHIVWAALAGDDQVKNGEYSSMSLVREPSDYVLSKEGIEVQGRVWDELIQVLQTADGSVAGIVQNILQ